MYKVDKLICPFDKKMHKYGSIRDLSQNYALLELVETEQKRAQNKEIIDQNSTSEILCKESCFNDASTTDESEDDHHSCTSWIDKLASVKGELDNLKGFDVKSKLNNILSTCFADIE
jgi:hypothetical protein